MANQITGTIQSNGLKFVKATIDTIPFDKIKKNNAMAAQDLGVATSSNANVWTANGDISNYIPTINGVDIDWNAATLDNVELAVLDNKNTINTTGQLLALINDLQEQINAIVYIMNGGNTGGNNSNSGSGSGDGFTSTTTSSTVSPTPTPTQTGR
jgi:hypothetical protein